MAVSLLERQGYGGRDAGHKAPSGITVLERDNFGRVLFTYDETHTLDAMISQMSYDNYVYFYPGDTSLTMSRNSEHISSDDWSNLLELGFDEYNIALNRLLISFEDVDGLKERNDWNKELDMSKMVRVELTRFKDSEMSVVIEPYPFIDKSEQGDFIYELIDGGAVITRYAGDNPIVEIPFEIDGFPVIAIGDNAFRFRNIVTGVTIPDGVVSIGERAFADCRNLTEVIIPDSVVNIGEGAFEWCMSLEHITLPPGITTIEAFTFTDCQSLVEIIIPYGVTRIEEAAFWRCIGLINVHLPTSLTYIGVSAFRHCTALPGIVIPEGVEIIDVLAFRECYSLAEVSLPDSLIQISRHAFSWGPIFTSITIPKNVEYIGESAFWGADNLESINFEGPIPPDIRNAFTSSQYRLIQHLIND
jgi:hypothetical protein